MIGGQVDPDSLKTKSMLKWLNTEKQRPFHAYAKMIVIL